MKKLLALFLAACMVAAAGCSSSGSGGSPREAQSPLRAALPSLRKAKRITLKMSYWGSTVEDEAVKRCARCIRAKLGLP